ncbi:uncharacterized protein LOC123426685 [Hordeum vulgare subsp. vulgare]|uniref:uncharacterized protein LOC123426685 n=1 Tax=Hordeum vulgare subsp. vulgare TaxID=112509 RepID=UPI00162DCCA8|nr:uncharacterized protein LOC123426685 [Hordeum vulgare subsp. vulgare]
MEPTPVPSTASPDPPPRSSSPRTERPILPAAPSLARQVLVLVLSAGGPAGSSSRRRHHAGFECLALPAAATLLSGRIRPPRPPSLRATRPSKQVEKLVERMVKWLKVDGHIFFTESCFHQSGDSERKVNPTHYREPWFYTKMVPSSPTTYIGGNDKRSSTRTTPPPTSF